MQVKEMMSDRVICVTPENSLQEAAGFMCDYDIGSLPVVESAETKRLVGMITDRDITCRSVAEGRNPLELKVRDVMSPGPVHCVHPGSSEQELWRSMEEHQVRRMPVIDDEGNCCGIVSQADVARQAPEHETGELVQEISRPTAASRAE
jgi:CBS domain-containing protein